MSEPIKIAIHADGNDQSTLEERLKVLFEDYEITGEGTATATYDRPINTVKLIPFEDSTIYDVTSKRDKVIKEVKLIKSNKRQVYFDSDGNKYAIYYRNEQV